MTTTAKLYQQQTSDFIMHILRTEGPQTVAGLRRALQDFHTGGQFYEALATLDVEGQICWSDDYQLLIGAV